MKKLLVLLCAMTVSSPLMADNDKPIEIGQLPAPAREFIQQHFKDAQISLATVDRSVFGSTYEVFFAGGCKIEFDKEGQWKEMDCKHSRVPAEAIPAAIRNHIAANYPESYVTEIDRDKRDYEVKLDNGLELTFDLGLRLIEIDD